MKHLNLKFIVIALFALSLSLSSCGNKSQKNNNTDQTEQTGKEYTSAYICPMHCEGSGSDEPGKCPVCGMDYVKNEDHKMHGHNHHEDSEDGHGHHGHSEDGHNH